LNKLIVTSSGNQVARVGTTINNSSSATMTAGI
jgi:hypothetical protein